MTSFTFTSRLGPMRHAWGKGPRQGPTSTTIEWQGSTTPTTTKAAPAATTCTSTSPRISSIASWND
eukprot:3573117-Prorocentrum_lima.AAC.1